MKISRTKAYKFQPQQYEAMEIMASVTVDSADVGVSTDDLLAMDLAEMDEHIKDMGILCDSTLMLQLTPLLEEAEKMCDNKSSAHDVYDYNKGLRGA